MPVPDALNRAWTRKHDDPRHPLIPTTPRIVYPTSLHELIDLCTAPDQPLKAAGSHWGLSPAAISDHTFIETQDPTGSFPGMGRTLTNVIPSCLTSAYIRHMHEAEDGPWYLAHVESGKRVYQLYAELDQKVDLNDLATLGGQLKKRWGDERFDGPWGCATLGGAGGQTFVGAFTTGTHGGDFDRPPIADSVLAIHLVTDGGQHYWIEPDRDGVPPMVDEGRLEAEYGPGNGFDPGVKVVRDNQWFNAALVSAGRLGVIYSVVVRAVPQYSLYERRRLRYWQDIKAVIKDRTWDLFSTPPSVGTTYTPHSQVVSGQHFLQIALCLVPLANGTRNLVGVTQRWSLALSGNPPGRAERVGAITAPGVPGVSDPVFANVGKKEPYSPDPNDPLKGASPSVLEIACSNASFYAGIIDGVSTQIKDFVASHGAVVGPGIAAVGALGGGGLLAILPELALIAAILDGLLHLIDDNTRFSEVMNSVKNALLDPDNPDPATRAAGLLAWRMIYNEGFTQQQGPVDYEAISYAVMDKHHYGNTCEVNVDSVEVFFDATDTRLIAFVDALIAFEVAQESRGKSMVGYVSLRFCGPTAALIGMEQYDLTCAVEVACLRDVTGGDDVINYAVRLALNPNIGGILHWGQRNDSTRDDIDRLFGPGSGSDRIGAWRQILAGVTDRDAFSSDFTRRTGLEL